MSDPSLLVIAGPNGSGKSTLTDYLAKSGMEFGRYINADTIAKAKALDGEAGSRLAQALADEAREECLTRAVDFSFETVMSHPSKIAFMQRARSSGYLVTLYFVATGDPQLNVERVRARVALGGHAVPEDRVVARYHRSIALLPQAIACCHRGVIFDNSVAGDVQSSGRTALRPVAEIVANNDGTGFTCSSFRLFRFGASMPSSSRHSAASSPD